MITDGKQLDNNILPPARQAAQCKSSSRWDEGGITAPDTKYQFQSIKTFIRSYPVLDWKRYRWFVAQTPKAAITPGHPAQTKAEGCDRSALAIPEPYQDYMRQLMDFALQTAKSYDDLPLVIETDEKLKCDKYATLA